jgi:RNA polymerase sigma-70 factor (ECF subfamily)
MPTPISTARLLAELPRLRRYARILTDNPERADCLVEETLDRARKMHDEPAIERARRIELLALLRAVNAETHSSGRISAVSADGGGGMLAQVRALPLEQREVLVLAAVEKLSYAEIAALLRAASGDSRGPTRAGTRDASDERVESGVGAQRELIARP